MKKSQKVLTFIAFSLLALSEIFGQSFFYKPKNSKDEQNSQGYFSIVRHKDGTFTQTSLGTSVPDMSKISIAHGEEQFVISVISRANLYAKIEKEYESDGQTASILLDEKFPNNLLGCLEFYKSASNDKNLDINLADLQIFIDGNLEQKKVIGIQAVMNLTEFYTDDMKTVGGKNLPASIKITYAAGGLKNNKLYSEKIFFMSGEGEFVRWLKSTNVTLVKDKTATSISLEGNKDSAFKKTMMDKRKSNTLNLSEKTSDIDYRKLILNYKVLVIDGAKISKSNSSKSKVEPYSPGTQVNPLASW